MTGSYDKPTVAGDEGIFSEIGALSAGSVGDMSAPMESVIKGCIRRWPDTNRIYLESRIWKLINAGELKKVGDNLVIPESEEEKKDRRLCECACEFFNRKSREIKRIIRNTKSRGLSCSIYDEIIADCARFYHNMLTYRNGANYPGKTDHLDACHDLLMRALNKFNKFNIELNKKYKEC